LLLNALDAKKHFSINAHHKFSNLTSQKKNKIKQATNINSDSDTLQIVFNIIDKVPKHIKFHVFEYYIKGGNKIEKLTQKLSSIFKSYDVQKVITYINATKEESFVTEDGIALRNFLPFEREDCPILQGSLDKDLKKTDAIYVYILALGNSML
jgi:hypothetical protein